MNNNKIKKVRLINFQGHHDNTIELSNNLNAIVGPSGANKSGILKGIEWVYDNKVMGESRYGKSIHSHHIKVLTNKGKETLTENTSVEITFTDGHIVRKVSGKKPTYYEIIKPDGKELKLTAVGQSVPEQVSDIFNFTGLNFSHQWSRYMFMFDSPGQIAQQLNEFTNMELPDKILKRINSEAKQANAKLRVIEEDIEEKKEELKDYEKLDILEKALDNLQEICNNLDDVTEEHIYLTEAQDNISRFKEKLSQYKNTDKLEKSLKALNELNDNLLKEQDLILTMESCLDDFHYLTTKLEKYKSIEKVEESLKALNEIRLELDYITNEVSEMENDLESTKAIAMKIKALPSIAQEDLLKDLLEDAHRMDELEKLITNMTKDIGATKGLSVRLKEFNGVIEVLDGELEGQRCPTCGGKLNE